MRDNKTGRAAGQAVDRKSKWLMIPVSDVDRAKAFYQISAERHAIDIAVATNSARAKAPPTRQPRSSSEGKPRPSRLRRKAGPRRGRRGRDRAIVARGVDVSEVFLRARPLQQHRGEPARRRGEPRSFLFSFARSKTGTGKAGCPGDHDAAPGRE